VILDPLSEATQRAGPLIRTLRDDFSLPIHLILVPRLEITEDSALPITSYYRFVADSLSTLNGSSTPVASFQGLPANQVLTIRMDVPEPWDIQQGNVMQDTDNLRCDHESCGDAAYAASLKTITPDDIASDLHLTEVQYNLNGLLFFGQCYDVSDQTPPNGLQFTLSEATSTQTEPSSGTLVMKTVGYWQLQSNPGAWKLQIAENTRGSEIYEIVDGKVKKGGTLEVTNSSSSAKRTLLMKDFVNRMEVILVKRQSGYEEAQLFSQNDNDMDSDDDTIHVFSLATGHLYERFLKIMMLSVTKRASTKVKFWLLENFLSPSFKTSAYALAEKIGCEVEFITYKWPEWLRGQSEKQRIIWGYKILFLDVLFPLDLKKVIYVDADQVVRGDLKELMDLDLQGAPYGYTPMCESREETKGYQFWRNGFWPAHLRNKPYHISALYVVDLQQFRRQLVGDQLRSMYQQLTADPNNLSNLDQDLPNYTQHQIRIHSLPQDWLWCESWCSEETKATAKTIDLCNNPAHKEAKLSMAKRVISGDLFEESWVELDEEVLMYEEEYLSSISKQ
jgi:UDP-glucose:glycoprotein glucosyltransferase